ncbi:MAG TPA: hypothetical protein VFV87_06100 [Pirellulaceae bacterium]|nr:hypothetical protein [Pirellulaceae bacterium]
MLRNGVFGLLSLALFALPALGQEYKVEKVATSAPADELSPEIAAQLQPDGFKVIKGESRTVCEIWLAKELPAKADAKLSTEILYPLTPGQFVGVIRYPRKGADFRDQEIPSGVYTLRYSQQPVDGAHVGTSLTRDFLALLPAEKDRDPALLDYKALTTASKATTGTAHPGILSLQKAEDGGEALAIRENPEKEWTLVRFTAKVKQAGGAKDLPMELVVVGIAAE